MPEGRTRSGALAVAAGIFLSRVAGLVRERVLSYYLGLSPAADAFKAALRIPNFLQNLLGEGVLSASFIPVYVRLVKDRPEDASKVARAVGTLLALIASLIAVLGIALARPLVDVLAGGFDPAKRDLTIELVQILFPGTALLVMSAWCLGVLNSHRKFFLSYVSPVLWNAALIAACIIAGRRFAGHDDDSVAEWLAWGAVIGSAAQLVVQLPTVIALLRSLRPSLAVHDPGVQKTISAFGPVLLGRGSVQISAFIDQAIASYLGTGIVAAIGTQQILYTLPISLIGMSIAAAELPEMSSATGDEQQRIEHVRDRLTVGLRQAVFLAVPSAVAFVAIGGSIVALLFQTGRFSAANTEMVWIILAGSALGLSAGTQGRLLNSAFYSFHDTKHPLYAAVIRVAITGVLGFVFAIPLRHALGYSETWGAFGLTASAGFAAWIEFLLLDHWLGKRIGKVPVPAKLGLGALGASIVAGALAFGAGRVVAELGARTWMASIVAIGVFGGVYLGVMSAAKVPEAAAFTRRILRRRR